MAKNPAASYGTTLRCMDDVDTFFTTVTGLDAVIQDVYHRLTNDTILNVVEPDKGLGWGKDVTKLVGMAADKLARQGPVLAGMLQQDDRIETADVTVSAMPITIGSTLYAGTLDVRCVTALGPFRRIFGFNSMTVDDITNTLLGST